jgi:hypothetical protein
MQLSTSQTQTVIDRLDISHAQQTKLAVEYHRHATGMTLARPYFEKTMEVWEERDIELRLGSHSKPNKHYNLSANMSLSCGTVRCFVELVG